jgi:hypothetical protein
MSAYLPIYVVLRLKGDVDPADVAAEQTFSSAEEAEAACQRLQSEAEDGARLCVKETFFFSGSAVPEPH